MSDVPPSPTLQLIVGDPKHRSIFTLIEDTLHVKRHGDKKWPRIDTPLRHVIWAEVLNDVFEVSLLARKRRGKGSLSLVRITGTIDDEKKEEATRFTQSVIEAAYGGSIPKPRHLRVLVNPNSGPGRSIDVYKKRVEPLFRAARVVTDVTFTTHSGHATEIVRDLPLHKYDAIITMSGDGLIHEVLNGLAEHASPLTAMRTPIAPIPTGSGNGLSLNLLGIQEGCDVSAAALNAVKGQPMSIDLFSVTQKDKRVFSFMTQCIGLMSELDLWTENLRFMGNGRFIIGYLKGIFKHKACPVKLSIKVVESDKHAMVKNFHSARSQKSAPTSSNGTPIISAEITLEADHIISADGSKGDTQPLPKNGVEIETPTHTEPGSEGLPPLRYTGDISESEGWITFNKPVTYVYAGKGPYVGLDLMQFPVSLPDDGLIDVVIQEQVTRGELLKAMDGAELGKAFWMESQHYYKAEAYRVEPHSNKSCLAVDGEAYPFEPFQVEVHKGLANLLSPYGCYQAEFDLPK